MIATNNYSTRYKIIHMGKVIEKVVPILLTLGYGITHQVVQSECHNCPSTLACGITYRAIKAIDHDVTFIIVSMMHKCSPYQQLIIETMMNKEMHRVQLIMLDN